MRIPRTGVAALLVLVLLPAAAFAALKPSGTYKGSLHFKQAGQRITFAMKATFTKGKLTHLYGQGAGTPFDPKKSHGNCGSANVYDSADKSDKGKFKAKITGSLKSTGTFSYVLKDKFETAYLKGKFSSAKVAAAKFRIKSKSKFGTCDSGFLALPLKK